MLYMSRLFGVIVTRHNIVLMTRTYSRNHSTCSYTSCFRCLHIIFGAFAFCFFTFACPRRSDTGVSRWKMEESCSGISSSRQRTISKAQGHSSILFFLCRFRNIILLQVLMVLNCVCLNGEAGLFSRCKELN